LIKGYQAKFFNDFIQSLLRANQILIYNWRYKY
jgi:hypothetical protein